MIRKSSPPPSDPMTVPIAELARIADRNKFTFWRYGTQLRLQRPGGTDPVLLTAVRQRANELWSHFGGAKVDSPAIAFLEKLGVTPCIPTTIEDARREIELLAQTALAHTPADLDERPPLLGCDIETAANAGEDHRPPIKLRRDGFPIERQPKPTDHPALDPRRSHIRLIQLYGGGERCLILDFERLPLALLTEELQACFARHTLILHNGCFELAFFTLAGVAVPQFEDVLQAAGLLHGVWHRSLEKAAEYGLGILDVPKALQSSDWSAPRLSEGQYCYPAADAVLVYRCWLKFRTELQALGRGFAYLLQRDVTPAVVGMHLRGVLLDRAAHQQQVNTWRQDLEEARSRFQTAAGIEPPTKPNDVRTYLRRVLPPEQLISWPKTPKKGELSTRNADLSRVAQLPAIRALLDIGAREKLLSSFGDSLAAKISEQTGRLHPNFNIAGTKTGRFSSQNPNIQQIPKHKAAGFRACFVAAPGHVLVVADYSAMELRAAGALSGDPAMIADFANGVDPHRRLAADMLGIEQHAVTDQQRDAAKPIGFMAIYGAGARGVAAAAYSNYGIDLSIEEAAAGLYLSLSRNHVHAQWMRDHYVECTLAGEIKIGRLGRVIKAEWEVPSADRHQAEGVDDEAFRDSDFDSDDDDDFNGFRSNGGAAAKLSSSSTSRPVEALRYTLCCNAPVQGACADAGMLALLLIDRALKAAGIPGGPCLFVHDEVALEVPSEHADQAAELLRWAMEQGFAETFPGAPLNDLVSVRIAASWGKSAAHAPLPPSSAERWMACPGSVRAERLAAASPGPSEFAAEGTAAHELFARCLLEQISPGQLTEDPSFAEPLMVAVTAATELIAGRRFIVEQRLPALAWLPQVWGTSDVIVFDEHDRVVMIIDLKFGRLVVVEATTVQLQIYALLAAARYGASPDGITTAIIQPRASHPEGQARQHHYSTADLDNLVGRLSEAVAMTEQPDAPRKGGLWCRFCLAAGDCPQYQRPPPPPVVSAVWGQTVSGARA